ncbi:MAG: hypothetical protein IID39_02290 [Planctomycetes bacterium]|nr:hypothetical protein [Planctomycetota bacterium]
MLRLVSWNINRSDEAWRTLVQMKDVDAAILQEAKPPPDDVKNQVALDMDPPWYTGGAGLHRPWRAAVVGLSKRVAMEPLVAKTIQDAEPGELAVSRVGTLAVARLMIPDTPRPFIIASMYGAWERPASVTESSWIYADASVHRVISDLSALVGRQNGHRIIAAGDLNILRGYGEEGSRYWKNRYETIFARMEALGLVYAGPTLPDGGIPPLVRPPELPADSTTVPTFRTSRSEPESATRQLDFVFVSAELVGRVEVRAMNDQAEWGPSDHSRLLIEIA